jgi:hypothetical protein
MTANTDIFSVEVPAFSAHHGVGMLEVPAHWRRWAYDKLQALPGEVGPDRDPARVMAQAFRSDCEWHVSHPFNRLDGNQQAQERLWQPLLRAFPDLERRTDIFMAGHWDGHIDGGQGWWTSSTGHYLGTMRGPWLGLKAQGSPVRIRFGEFHRWSEGQVVEARLLWDLVDVARQCGVDALPRPTGWETWVPGPQHHDGLLLEPSNVTHTRHSYDRVLDMLGGLRRFNQSDLSSMGMEAFWHPAMMWYGPAGIGTSRGVDGFQRHHQAPFLKAFPDRRGGHHRARIADGDYVCSTGWPSIHATHQGPYLGTAATDQAITMRVMDWWRCEGALLRENWVFIDLPHLFLQFGVELAGIAVD